MSAIAVNGRFLHKARICGVERYGREVVARLPEYVPLNVRQPAHGALAYHHLWEQAILPSHLDKGTLLFNPCNLAPLCHPANVITLHDAIPLAYPQFYRPAFRLYYRALIPTLARRAVHVITVSEYSRRQITRFTGISEKKITVIPNGVSHRFHPALRSPGSELFARYRIVRPYILYTGSLEPRKNVVALLKAFAFAREHLGLEGYELLVAGSGHPIFAPAGLGASPWLDVRFLGYVDDADLPSLYANAELFVYPSLCEGFGLPPLEAMAAGVVALVSQGSALEEMTIEPELRFAAHDYRGLAEKICYILERPSLRLAYSRKGLERARQFSWQRTAERTAQVLAAYG
ncbi:MAG: glycosyltransferase family 4 protein [Aphanocapsa lilacina HA4352-LM1]|jgi:glycosyltransferase involved in cell wall biosynthesis|nr:glycosyltransferase family 4 protein [Aphanocapsa lilacina HA4352-LM1]